MLKTMSAAVLALSVIAAPAFAAETAKTTEPAKATQATGKPADVKADAKTEVKKNDVKADVKTDGKATTGAATTTTTGKTDTKTDARKDHQSSATPGSLNANASMGKDAPAAKPAH